MRYTAGLVACLVLTASCARPRAVSAPAPVTPAPVVVTPAPPAVTSIHGSISYRQKVALAPNVVVTIQLVAVTSEDPRGVVIATEEVRPEGRQIPIPFTLSVRQSALDDDTSYQLRVRITEGKVLRFITRAVHPIELGELPAVYHVLVEAVAQRLM